MNAADLERLVERELRALPTPRAPETLLPRVLASTVHQAQPLAAQSVLGSIRRQHASRKAWKLASLVALVALAVAGGLFAWDPGAAAVSVVRVARTAQGSTLAAFALVREATALTRVVWHLLLQPIATYLLILSLSFSLACAGVWTALNRLVLGGASRS